MNHKTFSELVANRIENCHDILNQKDKEYSSGDDRFHNFKKAGQMKGQDPIQALDGMWLKHRVSLEDMLDKLAKDPGYVPSKKYIAEKLGDMINYTLLLEGLIEDRRKSIENPLFRNIPFNSVEQGSQKCLDCGVLNDLHRKTCIGCDCFLR